MSQVSPSYSFASLSKDWDEKSVGVKVNWLRQNFWRMNAIWLWRRDCLFLFFLPSKCFGLNASLCHQLATHPCTSRRCSRQIHCSSIHQMDFYLPFYLARDSGEGKLLCCFLPPTLEWEEKDASHSNHQDKPLRTAEWIFTWCISAECSLHQKNKYVEFIHVDA